jgi:1-phosphofructokinase family hexose kinase
LAVKPALIVALNPSIDAEWRAKDVLWEEKNIVESERRWAGGKGINVARWLKHLGGKPRLVMPLGGLTGKELAAYVRAEAISAQIVRIHATTRTNVIVTAQNSRQVRFNPPGPELSSTECRRLVSVIEKQLARAGLLVLSGSLPRGMPVDTYARLCRLARCSGVRTLVDCDGRAFAVTVRSRPFLLKPNEHELAQWAGMKRRTEHSVFRAARALSRASKGWVLVSRGAGRGLLVNVSEGIQTSATPPLVQAQNTVGAGDAMVAAVALAIQRGAPPGDWLRAGLAVGAAATQSDAGELPEKSVFDRIVAQA